MALFIYANEISIPVSHSHGEEAITGVGALLTRDPIEDTLIADSLQLLADQTREEGKGIDTAVERGHYRPLEDSDVARTHLLATINRHVKGLFMVTFFDQPPSPNGRVERLLYQFLNTVAARIIASEPVVHLRMIDKLDTDMEVRAWNGQILSIISGTQIDHIGEKTFYPVFDIESGSHSSTGLMVLNLLLWAAVNTRLPEPDGHWQDSIGFIEDGFFTNGETLTHHYSLNAPADHFVHRYPYAIKPENSRDKGIFGLVIMERFFRQLTPAHFSGDNPYLAAPCLSIINQLAQAGHRLETALLSRIVSTFLGVFDLLPVYDAQTDGEEDWQDWLLAKEVAIRLGPGNPVAFEQLVETYNVWRENILVHQYEEWCRLMRIPPHGG